MEQPTKLYDSLVDAFVVVGVDFNEEVKPRLPTANTATATAILYEPNVLDCIPKEKQQQDVIRALPMFCMPEGVQTSSEHGKPRFYATVFTDECGNRCNAYCLTFYDQQPASQDDRTFPIKSDNTEDDKKDVNSSMMRRSARISLPISHSMSSTKFQDDQQLHYRFSIGSLLNRTSSTELDTLGTPSFLSREVGHPLGQMGTNLQAQIDYTMKRKSSSDASSGSTSGEDYSSSGGSSIAVSDTESIGNRTNAGKYVRIARKRGTTIQLQRSVTQSDTESAPLPVYRSKSSHEVKVNLETLLEQSKKTMDQNDADLRDDSIWGSINKLVEDESKEGSAVHEYYSKCLVIVSKFAYFQLFKEYLTQVYQFVCQKAKGKFSLIPLEKYLSNLIYEVVIPPPSNDLQLRICGPLGSQYPLYLSTPAHNDLPLLDSPIRTLFLTLDKRNILRLITALLVERKVLFAAANPHLLYIVSEALLSLLYPFTWEYVYIPNLPPTLVDYTQAPTSFVMGISSEIIHDLELTDDTVLVDLDNNQIITEGGALPSIPEEAAIQLNLHLTEHIFPELKDCDQIQYIPHSGNTAEQIANRQAYHDHQIRMSFASFFVSVLFDFTAYVNDETEDIDDTFDADAYLDKHVVSDHDFWAEFLKTSLFSTFVQKLASQEKHFSLGLFLELSKQVQGCRNCAERFKLILNRPYKPKQRTNSEKITINMNDPTSSDLVEYNWNPLCFPRIDNDLTHSGKKIDVSSAITNINVSIRANKSSPELFVLKCYFHMQQYHQNSDEQILLDAYQACVSAYCLDQNSIPQFYLNTLINKMSDAELHKIINTSKISLVSKIAKGVLENRKIEQLNVGANSSDDEPSADHGKSLSRLMEEYDMDGEPGSPAVPCNNVEFISRVRLFKQAIQCFEVPSGGVHIRRLVRFLSEHQIITDDSSIIVHFENAMLKNQQKKRLVSKKSVTRLFTYIERVLEECDIYQKKFSPILGPKEMALFSSAAATTSGKRGNLLLTQKRLIFASKGKIIKQTNLEEILIVEPHTVYALIPGGVPFIKCATRKKMHLYSIWNSQIRNKWVIDLADITASWRMANDLKDKQIVTEAQQNLILAAVMKRMGVKSDHFQYFHTAYPNRGWFRIPLVFQTKGMLNTEVVCEQSVIEDQLVVVVDILQSLVRQLHSFVNLDAPDVVNFRLLKQSEEYSFFLTKCAQLQRFSLNQFTPEETTVLFVYLYNIIVIHAYIELEQFPSNIWEWRYLERTAYYTIGGVAYSLWDIHHGLLRHNKPPPYSTELPFYEDDPRKAILQSIVSIPLILFTLSQHTFYSPSMFKLEPENLETDVDHAATLFCHDTISIKNDVISLPILFKHYQSDFGGLPETLLCWLVSSKYLSQQQKKKLEVLLLDGKYEIEWLDSWTPSPKLLVGTHHF